MMWKLKFTQTLGKSTPALQNRLFLGFTTGFMVLSRILTLNPTLTNPESVNFALALHRFDLTSQSPPLPGYPVYIFLSKIFSFFGLSDAIALVLPGILSAAFAVYPLYYLVKKLHGDEDARLAVLLYAVNPGLWIISLRPSYTALLLFPFLLALRMFLRVVLLPTHLKHQTRFLSFYTGTLALGILCGITLDTLVLFVPLLLFTFYGLFKLKRTRIMSEMINGLIVGVLVWMVPFLFSISLADIIARPDYGEIPYVSAASAMTIGLFGKLKLFLWDILAFGFLGPLPSPVLALPGSILGFALVWAIYNMRLEYKYFFLLTFFVPYVLFLLFFRNLSLPGHLVLLIPMVIVFVSAGLATLPRRVFIILSAGLVIFSLVLGAHRALLYKRSTSPQTEMALTVKSRIPDNSILFGAGSIRLLRYYVPEVRCYGIQSISELDKPFSRKLMKDKSVYLISDIQGIEKLGTQIKETAVFPPKPYLFGQSDTLKLYSFFPDSGLSRLAEAQAPNTHQPEKNSKTDF